jgi:hypothetical protein
LTARRTVWTANLWRAFCSVGEVAASWKSE